VTVLLKKNKDNQGAGYYSMPPNNVSRYIVRMSETRVFGRVSFLLNLHRIALAMNFTKKFETKNQIDKMSEWIDCEVWTDQPIEMFERLRASFRKHPELVTVYKNHKDPSNEINIWQMD